MPVESSLQVSLHLHLYRSQPDLSSVRPTPSVQHNETHAAPIVKTKVRSVLRSTAFIYQCSIPIFHIDEIMVITLVFQHSSENFYENSSSVSQHSGVNQNNEVYTSQVSINI